MTQQALIFFTHFFYQPDDWSGYLVCHYFLHDIPTTGLLEWISCLVRCGQLLTRVFRSEESRSL